MSFKNVNDEDIQYCEQQVKKIGIAIEGQLNDSADMNCERDDDYLVKTFGKNFAASPSQFHFLRGELKLIKEIVNHVKTVVDANGKNTGLQRFQFKENQTRKRRVKQVARSDTQPSTCEHTKTQATASNNIPKKIKKISRHGPNELKAALFNRIKTCLIEYAADIDFEQLNENIVDVKTEQSKIIGNVVCVICNNNKNNKPKKVYYDDATSYWAIANFQTHLKKKHRLLSTIPKSKTHNVDNDDDDDDVEVNESVKIIKSTDDETENISIDNSSNEDSEHCMNNNPPVNRTVVKIEKAENWIYYQLTTQINNMTAAVLESGSIEYSMVFELQKGLICHLMVALIDGDGNCLFAAIAHQLFKCSPNTAKHKELTKLLRSEAVEYILKNIQSFEHTLKDRVYAVKDASEISDISTECKIFVRHVLSRNGTYGGYESVKALSELYKINIITFYEDESCYIEPKKNMHDKTIAIAYRFGYDNNNEKVRNHYDSVSDMNSEYIMAASDLIINKRVK